MILLTGAAGFIGSNILRALGRRGASVIAVDDLTDGRKCVNLAGCGFSDYLDVGELMEAITTDRLPRLTGICHQGGCVDTTASDGRAVMRANFSFSKAMLALAERHGCPLVYASSAAVYGDGRHGFREAAECERPRSPYAVSKWAFDQFLRRRFTAAPPPVPIVGLRYFNVYGPGESHKGRMASVAWHAFEAIRQGCPPRIFTGSEGFVRDFVAVADVVAVNLHFLATPPPTLAILNVGTGVPRSFRELAEIVAAVAGGPSPIEIPFPEDLRGRYQSYTCADITALRAAGYGRVFERLEDGIAAYHRALGVVETTEK
jgi:ADP-L-glycero-D-manno-heptose 6-epimerase